MRILVLQVSDSTFTKSYSLKTGRIPLARNSASSTPIRNAAMEPTLPKIASRILVSPPEPAKLADELGAR